MCRHIFNVQAIIQAPCCQKWFDCAECHDEVSDHPLRFDPKLRLQCKSCTRIFQKDLTMLTERDRKCEGCDKFWNIRGVTPESVLVDQCRVYIQETLVNIIADAGLPEPKTS